MIARRLLRARVALLVASVATAGAVAAGCTEAGRSILQASVTADASVTTLHTVELVVKQAGGVIARQSYPWDASGIHVGIYLSSSVSGDVQVYAVGPDSVAPIAQSLTETVRVTAGQNTAEVALRLLPFRPDVDGGVDSGGPDTGPGTDAGPDTTPAPDAGADKGAEVAPDVARDLPPAETGGDAPATDTGGDHPPADAGTDVPPAMRSWGAPTLAENNIDEDDTDPAVVVDTNDRATVAYQHGFGVWINHVNTSTDVRGTEGAIPGATMGANSVNAVVGVDGNGVATVMWEGLIDDPTNQGIWSSTATPTGWSAPYRVSSGRAFYSTLAVSANGVAIAGWTENNLVGGLNQYIVWTSYRPAGGQWMPARSIMTASETGDRTTHVSLDSTGKGFLIWEQPQTATGSDHIWVSRFSGSGFDPAMRLDTYDAGDSTAPNIAVGPAGGAAAVWNQLYSDHRELWGAVYAAGAWGPATLVQSASYIDRTYPPGVAVDAAGNAATVFSQSTATGPYNVRVARHRAGQPTWDAPVPIESNDESQGNTPADLPAPIVAFDGAGNAIILWRKTNTAGLTSLYSIGLSSAGAMGTVVRLDNDDSNGVFGHQLAVAQDGTASAVWYHAHVFNIMASVYR